MEDHEYVLISRSGEAASCVDNVPDELTKLNCKTLILRLPGLVNNQPLLVGIGGETYMGVCADVEIEIPEGFYPKLVRRTTISATVNGDDSKKAMDREWKFVVTIAPLKQERCESVANARS